MHPGGCEQKGTLTDDGRELLLRLEARLSELPFFTLEFVTGLLIATTLAVLTWSLSVTPFGVDCAADGASDRLVSSGAKDLGRSALSNAGMLRRRTLLDSA